MEKELMPYFSKRYAGPPRVWGPDLKHQSLLKHTINGEGRRKYLWVTVWDGAPREFVQGSSFKTLGMTSLEETEALLAKLVSFGKRAIETIFSELVSLEIATNT